ncbi:MAG TPA: hypothetical protein PKE45_09215, partial [Caldilineaceae bacterium]|nr:hypothetical protein [Caldilineaceae bacterium]
MNKEIAPTRAVIKPSSIFADSLQRNDAEEQRRQAKPISVLCVSAAWRLGVKLSIHFNATTQRSKGAKQNQSQCFASLQLGALALSCRFTSTPRRRGAKAPSKTNLSALRL